MRFNPEIPVYGNQSFRGKCPMETAEQVTFVNWIRRTYPDSYGALVIHIKNEGKRTNNQIMMDKAEGLTVGAPDIVLPNFYMEMKRRDHTKSQWQPGQEKYLIAAKNAGAFVCVALGYEAAKEAFLCYLNTTTRTTNIG